MDSVAALPQVLWRSWLCSPKSQEPKREGTLWRTYESTTSFLAPFIWVGKKIDFLWMKPAANYNILSLAQLSPVSAREEANSSLLPDATRMPGCEASTHPCAGALLLLPDLGGEAGIPLVFSV